MPKGEHLVGKKSGNNFALDTSVQPTSEQKKEGWLVRNLSLIHISEPTRPY